MQLRAKDLLPFQSVVDAGLPMVMTGHIAVTALDPGVPASVSKAAYAELRRMGFKGVAVTDALNMAAIQDRYPNDSAAPLALAAGADLLLMPADVEAAHAAIVGAVRSGALPPARLAEAAQRVVTMMIWRGRSGQGPGTAPGSGSELSQKVSRAAITVLAGPCRRSDRAVQRPCGRRFGAGPVALRRIREQGRHQHRRGPACPADRCRTTAACTGGGSRGGGGPRCALAAGRRHGPQQNRGLRPQPGRVRRAGLGSCRDCHGPRQTSGRRRVPARGHRLRLRPAPAGTGLSFNGRVPILNKDMTLCISLSARPSNNGTRFHNHLYDQLGLNWIYKAFAPTDLAQAIAGVRGLGIRGCAVSMPYKEDVMALVDVMDPSAKAIDSVNTIVNDGGTLTAYNTDYTAIEQLLQRNAVPASYSVWLLGAGGMAKATAAALRDAGFRDVTVIARNEEAGRALAGLYGFAWRADVDPAGAGAADMIINVTPIGMAGGPDAEALSFPQEVLDAATGGLRRRRAARRDPADQGRPCSRQDGDHRCGGGDHPGAGAVCALHRDPAQRRAGPGSRGLHAGSVARAGSGRCGHWTGSTEMATRSSPILVRTRVAVFFPLFLALPDLPPGSSCLRSSSGVTAVPRFLMSSTPMPWSLTQALSALTLYGITSRTL